MGLESHDVVERPVLVVLPQLNDGIALRACARIAQPDGLHRSESERVLASPRHDLHGHAALENAAVVKAVDGRLLCRRERLPERRILISRHRTVDIIRRAAVIARGEKSARHIDAVEGHDRRGRIVEMQIFVRTEGGDSVAQGVACQRAGRDDDLAGRDLRHLPRLQRDVRMRADALRDHPRIARAVNGERAAGWDPVRVGASDDEAAQAPHLLLQQTDGVRQVVAAEGIGTDELGKIGRDVRGRHLRRLHLDEADADAALRHLPRRLASGKAGAYDGNLRVHLSSPLSLSSACGSLTFSPSFRRRMSSRPALRRPSSHPASCRSSSSYSRACPPAGSSSRPR